MTQKTKYYVILVAVSFVVGTLLQGVVSLLTWTAYPLKAYLFSGLFWGMVWPPIQLMLDKYKK